MHVLLLLQKTVVEWNSMSSNDQFSHLDKYLSCDVKQDIPMTSILMEKTTGGRKVGDRLPRNPTSTQAERTAQQVHSSSTSGSSVPDSRYFENNEPFVVRLVAGVDKRCLGCYGEFLRVAPSSCDMLVLSHKERFVYPDMEGRWTKISLVKMRDHTYHVRRNCLLLRAFRAEYLNGSKVLCSPTLHLNEEQQALIRELGMTLA